MVVHGGAAVSPPVDDDGFYYAEIEACPGCDDRGGRPHSRACVERMRRDNEAIEERLQRIVVEEAEAAELALAAEVPLPEAPK